MNRFAVFLIFLAVVVSVGAVLYIVNPLPGIYKENDKKRIKDLQEISKILEFYHEDYGKYPDYDKKTYTIKTKDGEFLWGEEFLPYSKRLPKDSFLLKKYVYWSDGESYKIYASLDDPANILSCSKTKECENVPEPGLCGMNALCNYGITSGNISP